MVYIAQNTKTSVYYLLVFAYLIGGIVAVSLSSLYNFNKEHIGLVFLFGAIVPYLGVKYNDLFLTNNAKKSRSHFLSHFNIITFIMWQFLILCSVVLFINSKQKYYLPWEYFLLISLAVLIILIQILFSEQLSKSEIYLILFEIFTLSSAVSASVLFLFPSFYGNDASYHVGFIQNILNIGYVGDYLGVYQTYPIYHLLSVAISLISGLNDLKIVQFLLTIIQVLFFIFVYMVTKKLFNYKVALISTLSISFATHLLQPRYMYFPNSFSTVFFIFILYLFFYSEGKNAKVSLILVIIYFVTLFSHPLTPAIILTLFIAIFSVSKFSELKNIHVNLTLILLMMVSILKKWMTTISGRQDVFNQILISVKNALEVDDLTSVGSVTLSSMYSFLDIILSDLGYTILILLGIIGAFYTLRIEHVHGVSENKDKVLSLSTLTLLFIPIPYILTLVYPQSLPDRWFPFTEVFASMFAGVSILVFYQRLSKYKLHYIAVLIMVIAIFFMITTPVSNPNSMLYATNLSGRSALTSSEICASEFLNPINLNQIHGNSNFMVIAFNKAFIDRNDNFINPNDPDTYNKGFVVVRNYDLKKGYFIHLFGANNKLLEIILPNEEFKLHLSNINKIYSNNEVGIYRNLNLNSDELGYKY